MPRGSAAFAVCSRSLFARGNLPGVDVVSADVSADDPDVSRLGSLLALRDVELDPLPFLKAAVAATGDRAEMSEHVRATLHRDEAVALLAAELLHRALRHRDLPRPGCGAPPQRWGTAPPTIPVTRRGGCRPCGRPSVLGGRNNSRAAEERDRLASTRAGARARLLSRHGRDRPRLGAQRRPEQHRSAAHACLRAQVRMPPSPEATMGSGWPCRRAGTRAAAATAPGTEPLAGQFGVAPGGNWRGSGHTPVHPCRRPRPATPG